MTKKSDLERGKWHNSMEFIMSCLGFSVGVGSLWKFPHVVMRNGGGTFLIVSAIFLVVCGIPVLYLETAMGQYFSLSPLKLWGIYPVSQGIGIAMVVLSIVFSIYYNTLVTWTLYYCAMSFQSVPPWTTCDHPWNSETCVPILRGDNNTSMLLSSSESSNSTLLTHSSNTTYMLATEEFWTYNVLNLSRGFEEMGTLKWQLVLCVCGAWAIVFLCLFKGVFSSRIAVYITAPAPFILLTILLIRGATLPGSLDGVIYYLTPDWERLKAPQVWIEGVIFGFYSLGVGYGAIITLGSYNSFHDNAFSMSVIVSLADFFAAIYCGFALFTILGYMAHETGVNVADIRNSGPGLIFITYPHTASMLPLPQLWSALFFITCILLAVDSQFGAFKCLTSGLFDIYPETLGNHKTTVTLVCVLCGNLLGLIFITQGGMYYFQVVDWYSAALATTLIAFSEGFVIAWIYGVDKFGDHILQMNPKFSKFLLKICKYHWKYFLPVLCAVVLVITMIRFKPPTLNSYEYPQSAVIVGWIIAIGMVAPIPITMFYHLLKTGGSLRERWAILLTRNDSVRTYHTCEKCPDKTLFSEPPINTEMHLDYIQSTQDEQKYFINPSV